MRSNGLQGEAIVFPGVASVGGRATRHWTYE